jgi:hypothetical protein
MWATTSTIYVGSSSDIKREGTFYKDGSVVGTGYWCQSAVVAPITLTGFVSSSSGYVDAKRSSTLTISVPSGLKISSYSIGLKLTGSTTACKVGEVSLSNSESKTISASEINANSSTITFTDITVDNNDECLIQISDFSVVVDGIAETFTREINAANGQFYSGDSPKTWTSGSSLFGNKWLSTATNPQITFYRGDTPGSGSNNIIIDADFRINSDTYHISVPDRYRIKGYVITGYTGSGKTYTITPDAQNAKSISTDSDKPTTVYVDGLDAASTTFVVGGSSTGNPWIYITSFRVAVEDLVTKANTVLDELKNISVYTSNATLAKIALTSTTSQADIENIMNTAMNINVALKNKDDSRSSKPYLSATGARIFGETFSSDAAWKLTNYNAERGTFKLYNLPHEVFMASLPSTWNRAAEPTTNASSAGVFVPQNKSGAIALGSPDLTYGDDAYNAIHLSGSYTAVRWSATSSASQWTVENVYSITYNHYKVADAANPSKEGAKLIGSSTNYYISGTEITYNDPIDGLTPVTSLNNKPSDGAISDDVVVDYYYEQDATLPFTTSTITNGELDNPTWYYMQVNGLATYPSGDRMVVDGSRTGLNYERWCFVGDAIYGVQIFAESKGVAYPLNISSMDNNDNVRISSTSTNTLWLVSGSDLSNLVIYQKSGETTYALHQLGGTSDGSGWYWKVGLWSSGSTVKLSAAASNMPYDWAKEAVNYIPAQSEYTNAETIGWPSKTAHATLNTALMTFGKGTSYANYSALLSAWNTYKTTTDITTPPAGFYRIKSVSNWSSAPNKYLVGTNSAKSNYTSRAAYDGDASNPLNIWYYDGSMLTNYGNGGYQAVVVSNNVSNPSSVTAGTTFAFQKANSVTDWEIFNIKFNNERYLYTQTDNTYYYTDSGSGTPSASGYRFNVEKVTSLPVTFNSAALGYATFNSPVALQVPEGVKAYVCTIDESTIKFFNANKYTDGDGNWILPANTAVLLYNKDYLTDETKDFTIVSEEGSYGEGENKFEGTVAAVNPATGCTYYSLRKTKNANTMGFYQRTSTAALAGFRAWIVDNTGGARNFTIVFDGDSDPTGIVEAMGLENDNVEIYDLNGRKLSSYQKGINIINGKKIFK